MGSQTKAVLNESQAQAVPNESQTETVIPPRLLWKLAGLVDAWRERAEQWKSCAGELPTASADKLSVASRVAVYQVAAEELDTLLHDTRLYL